MNSPRISVVVPVYKVADVLPRCIDSILGQTFEDFELILVDDGSPDQSGAICDEYQARDPRIRVIHKKNGGVSTARNAGLDVATGRYVCFIDSDDWVEDRYLELFIYPDTAPDCLVIQNIRQEYGERSYKKYDFPDRVVPIDEFPSFFAETQIVSLGYPFTKLFLREIIEAHAIRFRNDMAMTEDLLFFLEYMLHVNSIQFVSTAYYHYIYANNPSSLSQILQPFEKEKILLESVLKALDDLEQKFPIDIHKKQEAIGGYVRRAIRSLYVPGYRKNYRQRRALLKELATPEYKRCLHMNCRKYHLPHYATAVFLFRHDPLFSHDAYMTLFFFAKRIAAGRKK